MDRLLVLRIGCIGACGAALLAPELSSAERVLVGAGEHTYEWVRDWPRLPEGRILPYTHGCVVVDSKDRVYVTTETEAGVMVFDAAGTLVDEWGVELAGGLHGMALHAEGGQEYLYLAQARLGQVLKTTLTGEILWKLDYPAESGHYESASQYHPTSVAVLPSGDFYVADGYGLSWIHRYDSARRYVGSFGGPGQAPGKLGNPHGLLVDAPYGRPYLIVADRENGRLQGFGPGGELLWVRTEGLRRPCHVALRAGVMAVADITGVVTLLDTRGRVLARLGENPDPDLCDRVDVPVEKRRAGFFNSPHGVAFDSRGDLYVVDWLTPGRLTKLARVPASAGELAGDR